MIRSKEFLILMENKRKDYTSFKKKFQTILTVQQRCIIQSKLCIGWNNFCLWRLKGLQKDEEKKN